MNEKNNTKLQQVKKILTSKGFAYIEYPNGQLQIDRVNFWVTSEKFHDTKTGAIGIGLNTFINYLKG